MIKENKRNKKDNRQMLIARVEKIRPFVRNVCYVAKLKEAYPELEKIKSPKFHGVFTHGSLDENIIKKMECLFLPKQELV